MMSCKYKKITIVFLAVFFFIVCPTNTSAAIKKGDTLQTLRDDLQGLQNEKAASEKKKQQTEAQIKQNQSNVKNANDDITKAQNQITLLTDEINSNNEKIKALEAESQELLILYQKLSNENIYIKYATGAKSMTEMTMRIDAIKQVMDYNNKKINEVEQLVVSNNKMQRELAEYQTVLNEKISSYEVNINNLGVELKELVDEYEDIDSQISGLKQVIKFYQDSGCKEGEDLTTCVSILNNTGWLRPFSKGKVTSAWGYRIHPTKGTWKFHNGIDISDSGIEGRAIYATAAGTVGKITNRASCGGNMVYIWVYVNGKAYTVTYMHLWTVNVKVGDVVTTDSVIGTVGGGSKTPWDSCTTGAHLHLGVSGGHYLAAGDDGYRSYSTYISKSINPPGYPAKGSWFYSR